MKECYGQSFERYVSAPDDHAALEVAGAVPLTDSNFHHSKSELLVPRQLVKTKILSGATSPSVILDALASTLKEALPLAVNTA